jgi:hypothetical protein
MQCPLLFRLQSTAPALRLANDFAALPQTPALGLQEIPLKQPIHTHVEELTTMASIVVLPLAGAQQGNLMVFSAAEPA